MRYKFPYRFARAVDSKKTELSNLLSFGVSAVVPFVSAFEPSWSHAVASLVAPQLVFGVMGNVNLNCYDKISRDELPKVVSLRADKAGKSEWFSEPVSRKDVYFENGLMHGIGLAVSCASYGLGYFARNYFGS
ncbi:Uncharacterised protein [uncultured archaeon]|nr:Uncharacterised protein [uncultured archaeon]